MKRYGGAMFFAGVLALAGCSGSDGSVGPAGPAGTDGTNGSNGSDGAAGAPGQDASAIAKAESCSTCHPDAGAKHQAGYTALTNGLGPNAATNRFRVKDVSVTTSGTTSTLRFTVTKDGAPYVDEGLAGMARKSYSATKYDPATRTFDEASKITFASPVSIGNGVYEATGTANFVAESSNTMVHVLLADTKIFTGPGRVSMYDNVATGGKLYGTVDRISAANASGCEKCHPAPYVKHGYLLGKDGVLPEFGSCFTCHFGQEGDHRDWQLLVDDPAAYAAQDGVLTADQEAKYAYRATLMNDVHMSHAMEFAYPQSMANCVTCHDGKLSAVLNNANFTLETCKSCHPVTAVGGADEKRAPALKDLMTAGSLAAVHPFATDLYTYAGSCTGCHGSFARPFGEIHAGYNTAVFAKPATATYNSPGARFADTIKASIGDVTFDAATKILTVPFKVEGAAANAVVKPTVVISLYGYDTKDFIVSGHGSQADGKRNLEWAEGASGNSPRLTVTAVTGGFEAKADLTAWAAKLADGSVKKAEIGILPSLGLDQTKAISATNQAIAVGGATATYDLVGKAVVAGYGKDIVGKISGSIKCNTCHEALGTTFHGPNYGSAGVVGCRLCHVVGSGGSHLEMQSRSIDSYVHAIHAMQPFDVGGNDRTTGLPIWDFTNPVDAMRYEHHVGSTYPNFTLLNCESCHDAGKYNVPDQSKSLPGLTSKANAIPTWDRNIGAVPAYVTGPASRACGSCHRAYLINHDYAGALTSFNEHTGTFGTLIDATDSGSTKLEQAIQKIMAVFK